MSALFYGISGQYWLKERLVSFMASHNIEERQWFIPIYNFMYLQFLETNWFDRFCVVILGDIIVSIMIFALFHQLQTVIRRKNGNEYKYVVVDQIQKNQQQKNKNKTCFCISCSWNKLYHPLGIFRWRQSDNIFLIFPQKTGFAISGKLSSLETICMKWQCLFSGKN